MEGTDIVTIDLAENHFENRYNKAELLTKNRNGHMEVTFNKYVKHLSTPVTDADVFLCLPVEVI